MVAKIPSTIKQKILVGIIDYGFGNIASLKNALDFLGCPNQIIKKPKYDKKITHIILPGDGFFPKASKVIKEKGWSKFINKFISENKKILGICVGMQLFLSNSTEGKGAIGLELIKGCIEKFKLKKNYSLPHIGFNKVKFSEKKNYELDGFYYFIHSYRLKKINEKISDCALTEYGENFVSYFKKNNIYASQFHPEKSGQKGLSFLRNFILS